ncbi:MAG: hypothetical protein COZ06_11060 [Armatimonadetes bacterium CG_4_10_14_3_um_filter_66_18]|nr:MAG: hypothetical protein COZ06_11060 [Armatimonadetes bacterium CG_4_10_14_3_um_filter_66_18]PIZ49810.1 MAG: hypothetical protein COY42_03090 [Armatimonadetes bacterium CG_4_10_14_0_8_um_filter_66_14]
MSVLVDAPRVMKRLDVIRENVSALRDMQGLSAKELGASRRDLAAAKHFLRESTEAMIDIANHLCVKSLLGTPASAVDAVILLRDGNVFAPAHASTYATMVKYRNRLVHFYADVTLEEIWQLIQNELPDFEMFVGDVARYVAELDSAETTA